MLSYLAIDEVWLKSSFIFNNTLYMLMLFAAGHVHVTRPHRVRIHRVESLPPRQQKLSQVSK